MLQQGFEFLLRGGWIMWPLFACAIVSVAVMIERVYVLRRASARNHETADKVKTLLLDGRDDEALNAAQSANNPIGRVMAAGIRSRALRPALLEQTLQTAAMKELPALNRRLGILDTIVTLSPLLGLLGTITGMIRSFQVVATASGASAAPAITGGVAEALIATATGLAIAIVTLPVFNSLNERVREIIGEMELYGTQTQTILMERQPLNEEVARALAPATA
jgi:biopolymer transport protein ExbB